MKINKLTLLITLILLSLNTSAQNKIIEVTGQLISEETQKPVPYATIINIAKNKVTLSDTLGFFHITILEKETLRVSAIGYKTKFVNFRELNPNDINVYIIKLKKQVYEMANINIYQARWNDFVYEFKQIKTETNTTQNRIQAWFYTLVSPEELALITAGNSGIGIPVTFKSHREKQLQKLNELKQKARKSDIIYKKYNPEIVKKITKLEGKELDLFIKWCNFNTEFLYYANEYDILNAISKRFERYKRIKYF